MPLIGFGGAPFTLASYAIEGGPSRDYLRTKSFMYEQPSAWHRLCAIVRRLHERLPGGAGRGRRAGIAGLRLVGRRAQPERLPRVRASAHEEDPRRRRANRRAGDSLRRRDGRDSPGSRRRGRARDRRGLAPGRSTMRGPRSDRSAGSRAISIRRCSSARAIDCCRQPTTCFGARPGGGGTSSISVTGCFRTRRSRISRRSLATCTNDVCSVRLQTPVASGFSRTVTL